MNRLLTVLVVVPLLLLVPAHAQQPPKESFDYFAANREMIRNGLQAVLLCNGLFTSERTLEQVFAQELAYLRNPVGTANGGDYLVDRGRRAVAVGGGSSGQPRTELMPKTNSTFDSGTQNSQGAESQSGDRFGNPGLRQRDGFGTGGTNVLRPSLDDGASNSSSRRQYSDNTVHQADPIPGGLRPTTPAQLQPGPDGLQTAAQSTDMQAQYAARQPAAYGTPQAQTQYGGSATAQQDPARNSYSGDKSAGTTAGRYDAFQPSTASRAAPNASRSDAIASDGFGQPTGLSQNTGSYTVKPNDSFWSVSKKAYGTGDFYKALIEHNRQKFPDPSKIRVGDVIATPAVSDLRKNYPVFCPKERKSTRSPYRTTALAQNQGQRVYVVQEGDTIFNIARDELGKTARWADICELNRDLLGDDYDHLKPGWRLVLPLGGAATVPAAGDGRQDSLTRQIWSQIK
ncbi:MAG: LysM peptidoglycan-binding domain-containing protein [Planctomycetes bacterium]|nr:LysM peptidoglycan-binding domain-containing protein [Planctomycetota bacterium]